MPRDDAHSSREGSMADVLVHRARSPELGGTERRSHGMAGASSHLPAPLGRRALRTVGLACAPGPSVVPGSRRGTTSQRSQHGGGRSAMPRWGGRDVVFILREVIISTSSQSSTRPSKADGVSEPGELAIAVTAGCHADSRERERRGFPRGS